MIELAKTVQDGMADLAIFDKDLATENSTPEEMQKRMEAMKIELINKIKNNEEPAPKKASALRRKSIEESIEEQIIESDKSDRPKSRGRRHSNVSFLESSQIESTTTVVAVNNDDFKFKRENSVVEKKLSTKPIDKYCKDIIQDIEKSSKVIDSHVKQFNNSRFESDKLVEQLQAVDKLNELVNFKGEIPEETLKELNNNFKVLTDQVLDTAPTRKRSVSGRRNSRNNLLGDSNLSNQDLLDDLLGKK